MIRAGQGAVSAIAAVTENYAISDTVVRRFGTGPSDLDVNLGAPRPIAVTQLLVSSLGADSDTWWGLPIHARIILVVSIAELATGTPIEVFAACGCGETASVELSAAELGEFDRDAVGTRTTIDLAGGPSLRIPIGRDQLAWLSLDDAFDVAHAVLSRLVVDDRPLPPELVAVAERALADADPLVDFHVDTSCPGCDAPLKIAVDLEAIALGRLRRVQRTLIEEVHTLASSYHWSEAEIMRLPEWRRAEYLSMLGRGA